MQQESKWTPTPDTTPRNYMSTLQSNYPYSSNEYVPPHPNTNSSSTPLPGMTAQPNMSG